MSAPSRARLGVTGVENAVDIEGAMIKEVTPVSTAAAMGLRPGDVVFQFNERSIRSFQDLVEAMEPMKVGDKVSVQYRRDGRPMESTAFLIPTSAVPLNWSIGLPQEWSQEERGPIRMERIEIRR